MAQPTQQSPPVSMSFRLHSTLCDMADREDLPSGVPVESEDYPVLQFSHGHYFYEKQDGTGPIKQKP